MNVCPTLMAIFSLAATGPPTVSEQRVTEALVGRGYCELQFDVKEPVQVVLNYRLCQRKKLPKAVRIAFHDQVFRDLLTKGISSQSLMVEGERLEFTVTAK